jgi:NAD(P)H-hydrate repair Nnr-like enzyme with NAD(P)H-hydrate dehydratase domain
MRADDAAAVAPFLLGKAGEKASEGVSRRSVTASSVLDALPEILL